MLSDRDLLLLKHAEEYGITVSQCCNMYFNHAKYGMDLSRRRLRVLNERGFLKRGKSWDTGKTVYYTNKMPSTHSILLMDFYSQLILHGAEILEFKREYKTDILRSDGFIHYSYKDKELVHFIEVVLTHKLKYTPYETLKESGVIQEELGTFPSLVVIDQNPKPYKGKMLNTIYVDHSMSNFNQLVLP